MKKIFQKYIGKEGSFRRNSLFMSGGAVLNICIAFILTPVVTRLYTKEEFGVFYIYASIIAIGTLIINGMYPHAFVIPNKKRNFLSILKFCLTSSIIGSLFFFIFLLLTGVWFFNQIGELKLFEFWFLIPIGLFISSLNIIFVNWNIRNKEFKQNASSQVAISASKKGGEILYGSTIGGLFLGLIIADLISKFIGMLILGSKNIMKDFKSLVGISYLEQKEQIIKFKNYPKYILSSNFVNKFTNDIPLYLIAAKFGEGAVGAFGFANQMLNIPFNVIGNSIAPVYFQKANELHQTKPDELKRFTISTYNKILVLGCFSYGLIFGFGDIFFSTIFSHEWILAGEIAAILSIYFVFKLISSPFARIFRVLRIEEKTLLINIILAVSRIIGIYIGLYTGSLLFAIGCFTFGNLIGYLFNNFQVFIALKVSLKVIVWKTCILILPIFSLFYGLRKFVFNVLGL